MPWSQCHVGVVGVTGGCTESSDDWHCRSAKTAMAPCFSLSDFSRRTCCASSMSSRGNMHCSLLFSRCPTRLLSPTRYWTASTFLLPSRKATYYDTMMRTGGGFPFYKASSLLPPFVALTGCFSRGQSFQKYIVFQEILR